MDPATSAAPPFPASQGDLGLHQYSPLHDAGDGLHLLNHRQHLSRHQQQQQQQQSHHLHHPQQRRHSLHHHHQPLGTDGYRIPDFPDSLHVVPSSPIFDPHLPNLQRLDTTGALSLIHDGAFMHQVQPGGAYERDSTAPIAQIRVHTHQHHPHDIANGSPHQQHSLTHTPQRHAVPAALSPSSHSGPFLPNILGSNSVTTPTHAIGQLHHEDDIFESPHQPESSMGPPSTDTMESRPHGQLVSRIVLDPPDVDAWREKLFNVDETIVLTNDQFETYFPHIDNVYSHRSTQRYKRKPFISHYWDCRMKGRPPGTPKSEDPAKKKRKRNARERDLCDVKIKITEYFPGATVQLDEDEQHTFMESTLQNGPPEINSEKFWTIQRVNGNGGNGKGDGVAGPHKHTLDKSDEIKKSTVQRYLSMQEKEARKAQKPFQRKPSGQATQTVKKHNKENELKLYASCFCPFSQRVWIALEAKGMAYQYCEIDPSRKPTQLLEANPRGLVPAIREGDWASGESSVILEYLEDKHTGAPLFPTDARLKANCRLWIDHINNKIVPSFFALSRAHNPTLQFECTEQLQTEITALVQAADESGPYFLGADMCLVDIHFAPFAIRLSRLFPERRKWLAPMPGTRWHQWADALEHNPHVQATTSNIELYTETFDLFSTIQLQHSAPSINL
ncbi:hypothetical protein Micbo1qcDRAFT_233301 [Microdochium bolleyi]|uniref:GST N-terminal domain-containing protein n=1 Tax=Microdochium bolleyi TaxID=196109 RepID=A0A136J3Y9_9PEZI|nr:hypothetical protein Micbo1qcDRAFT_233301 [Microdochium bolleyi]